MRKYNAIKNAVRFGKGKKQMSEVIKPVSEMKLITPKRNTKWVRTWVDLRSSF